MKRPAKRPSKARAEDVLSHSQAPGSTAEQHVSSPPSAAPSQSAIFEEAVRLLHAGDFKHAKAMFEQAANGPSPEMSHAARVHARMCEHRISKPAAPELKTAEDHYNFAVTLINQRALQKAEEHLQQALKMSSDADHVHYAIALCRGLQGDVDGACRHLERAIELQPRNRQMARNDPDFLELFPHHSLLRLLYPEGMPSA